jgi:hypothetical protein
MWHLRRWQNGRECTVSKAKYQTAADVFDGWKDDVLTGKAPTLYPVGSGELARLEIGPGLVTLFGGPPGAGKTAFTMQLVIDALRMTPTLRALVCNIEMTPPVLLDRQLARLSGIDLRDIRYRRLTADYADRLDQAMNTLEPLAERLCFLRPPFDLENVAASADAFHAGLLLLDYIQRIPPPGNHGDRRGWGPPRVRRCDDELSAPICRRGCCCSRCRGCRTDEGPEGALVIRWRRLEPRIISGVFGTRIWGG